MSEHVALALALALLAQAGPAERVPAPGLHGDAFDTAVVRLVAVFAAGLLVMAFAVWRGSRTRKGK